MSLLEDQKIKKGIWGLNGDPFPDVPPRDPVKVSRFFADREEELKQAIRNLYNGRNIMVKGLWGIGKTAFILTALYRLIQQVADLDSGERVESVYIPDYRSNNSEKLEEILLASLGSIFDKNEPQGNYQLREIGANIKLPFLNINAKLQKQQEVKPLFTRSFTDYLNQAEKEKVKLVVAIDDLDKMEDQKAVQDIFNRFLNDFRDPRWAFIFTGRTLTHTFEELEKTQLGLIEAPVKLTPMNEDTLRIALINQMNVWRDKAINSPFPFTEEVVQIMVKESYGIPRVMNKMARGILDKALDHKFHEITKSEFEICYKEMSDSISINLSPDVKEILYYTFEKKGLRISDKKEDFSRLLDIFSSHPDFLNQAPTTVREVLTGLERLVKEDILIKQEDKTGIKYLPAPGMDKAIEEGGERFDEIV